METFLQRVDEMLPDKVILFVGDSAIQGLNVNAINAKGVNFGIGGDTTSGVLNRLGAYQSLQSASALVLAVGYNDLKDRNNDEIASTMEQLLRALPVDLRVICCGIYPTDEVARLEKLNHRIGSLNRAFEKLCSARERTVFVDFFPVLADENGNLRSGYGLDDGLHLSLLGRNAVVRELRNALSSIGVANSQVIE